VQQASGRRGPRNRFTRHVRDMVASGVDPAIAMGTAAQDTQTTAPAICKNGTVYCDTV